MIIKLSHWQYLILSNTFHKIYPEASSSDAFRGLSYTAIHSACAEWYQVIRISPHTLNNVSIEMQPTSQAKVVPFRAPLLQDFHLFIMHRVTSVSLHNYVNPHQSRVRVAQTQGS